MTKILSNCYIALSSEYKRGVWIGRGIIISVTIAATFLVFKIIDLSQSPEV